MYLNNIKYVILTHCCGLTQSGAWEPGGSDPPRIRDLCSKNFFKKFSYLFGPPLDKNRSQAPVYMQVQLFLTKNMNLTKRAENLCKSSPSAQKNCCVPSELRPTFSLQVKKFNTGVQGQIKSPKPCFIQVCIRISIFTTYLHTLSTKQVPTCMYSLKKTGFFFVNAPYRNFGI